MARDCPTGGGGRGGGGRGGGGGGRSGGEVEFSSVIYVLCFRVT